MGNMLSKSIARSVVDEDGTTTAVVTTAATTFDYLHNSLGKNLPKLDFVTDGGVSHTVQYDAAGNELSYLVPRTYSARNQMTAVTDEWEISPAHHISYGYDGRGIRSTRSEDPAGGAQPTATRDYIYSPELQLLSMSRDNNPNIWGKRAITHDTFNAKYDIVWFNGQPVAQIDYDGGRTLYTFNDHLGTPIAQGDPASASVTWRAEYEPFGSIWMVRAGSVADQPLRLPGQERVAATRAEAFHKLPHGWRGLMLRFAPMSLLLLLPLAVACDEIRVWPNASKFDAALRCGLLQVDVDRIAVSLGAPQPREYSNKRGIRERVSVKYGTAYSLFFDSGRLVEYQRRQYRGPMDLREFPKINLCTGARVSTVRLIVVTSNPAYSGAAVIIDGQTEALLSSMPMIRADVYIPSGHHELEVFKAGQPRRTTTLIIDPSEDEHTWTFR